MTGHQRPRGGVEVQLYSFSTSALEGSAPRPGRFTPGKGPVPIVQETGWAPGPVWTCAKNLALTWIRSPDRPARSQSLPRLNYPAHLWKASHRNFPPVYRTRNVVTDFTRPTPCPCSGAKSVHSTPLQSVLTFLYNVTLPSPLRSRKWPVFLHLSQQKPECTSSTPLKGTCPAHPIFPDFIM
jgi:hypothetical protein